MSERLSFDEVKQRNMPKLEQFVPVVARVHGPTHPEFYEVQKWFEAISEKVKAAGLYKPELDEEFVALRHITNDYAVPNDVCESYEAVYSMLAEVDEAYEKEGG